jgi:hypothetical protein
MSTMSTVPFSCLCRSGVLSPSAWTRRLDVLTINNIVFYATHTLRIPQLTAKLRSTLTYTYTHTHTHSSSPLPPLSSVESECL